MDAAKTGALIRSARVSLGFTQSQLAAQLGVSDKAVSKWERGVGCPDLSLITPLAKILGLGTDELLSGEVRESERRSDSMKRTSFFYCEQCGNVLTASGAASVTCCSRRLEPLAVRECDDAHALTVERVEDELYITTAHEMEKGHYIAFVAALEGDRLTLCRQYPEWEMRLRLPIRRRFTLLWYCTEHGLFRRIVAPM